MSVVVGDPLIPVKPQVSLFCQDGDDCIIPVQDAPCQDQEPEVSFEGGKFFEAFFGSFAIYPSDGQTCPFVTADKNRGTLLIAELTVFIRESATAWMLGP